MKGGSDRLVQESFPEPISAIRLFIVKKRSFLQEYSSKLQGKFPQVYKLAIYWKVALDPAFYCNYAYLSRHWWTIISRSLLIAVGHSLHGSQYTLRWFGQFSLFASQVNIHEISSKLTTRHRIWVISHTRISTHSNWIRHVHIHIYPCIFLVHFPWTGTYRLASIYCIPFVLCCRGWA